MLPTRMSLLSALQAQQLFLSDENQNYLAQVRETHKAVDD